MYEAIKRIFDIAVALLVGVITLPFLLVVAVLLWCAQGAVFFRQLRPGLHGRPFVLYKFCTMNNGRDAHGNLLADERRLTRIGMLVRSLSLDELPQLWNVLRGDMSLVGPRPLLMEYLDRYTPEQFRRHDVMPGITGWAQVNGRNSLNWDEKFAMDIWYVDHRSFLLDLRILCLTVLRVVARSGVSSPGQATMERFMGSDHDV